MVSEEIRNFGTGTNVLCKVCKQRRIFVNGPTTVSISDDGEVYLELRCPLPTCARAEKYAENELEIH